VGCTKRGKGTKIMLISEGRGLPVSVHTAAANEAEVNLIEPTLDRVSVLFGPPERLLYDRAADSDPLRERLDEKHDVELICPHRKNRKRPATQDGRKLRRFKRRFKIERLVAWLHNYRRTVVRWEYLPEMFEGFVQLACILILIKQFN
jgi:transposase